MNLLLVAGFTLLLGAGLSLVLPNNRARIGASLLAQLVATITTLLAVVPVLATGTPLNAALDWSFPVQSVAFEVDPLSAFFLAWSLPLTLLGSVYAVGYLDTDLKHGRNAGPHFALLAMLQVSYLMVYTALDCMVFLLGWEIAAVCAWLLVIWSYKNQRVRFAGFNYLVSTHIGLFVIAAALMTLHAQTNSMDFHVFAGKLAEPGELRDITFLLLGLAFALKAAFFPVHTWLPRAHSAAPAHISALMSGVIHKAGLFGFLRFTLLLGKPEEWMGWTILAFGATSAVVGALFTTTQRDLKRLLGYSSTENVGVAAMGFGVGYLGLTWDRPALVALGFGGGILHLFNHALFKCLLFYAAGAVYKATHTVDLERLGGLAKRMPVTAAVFVVGGLAIAGFPPLNGFVSEFLLYRALLGAGPSGNAGAAFVFFAACLAFTGALSAFSIVRAFGVVFLGAPREPEHGHPPTDPPWTMLAPMVLHALGVAAVGVAPVLGFAVASPAAAAFGDLGVARDALGTAAVANALTALAVVLPVVVGLLLGRGAPRSVTWGCGYTAPTLRMQYTGSSFVAPFAALFDAWVPPLVTAHLPEGLFPWKDSSFRSHYVDPIEHRLYEAMGQGEEMTKAAFGRVVTEPRAVFAAGLVFILLLAAFAGARS